MGDIKRYSADDLREMKRRGEVVVDADAIEGPMPEDEHWEELLHDGSEIGSAILLAVPADVIDAFRRESPDAWRERMAEVLREHAAGWRGPSPR